MRELWVPSLLVVHAIGLLAKDILGLHWLIGGHILDRFTKLSTLFCPSLGGPGNVWLLVKLLLWRMYTLWVCFKGVSSEKKLLNAPPEIGGYLIMRWVFKSKGL